MKKVIIFDFDGTLYSGSEIFKYVPDYVLKYRRNFLVDLTDEQYEKVCKENPRFLEVSVGRDVTAELYRLKEKYPDYPISTKAFCDTQETYVYDIYLEGAHIVDPKVVEKYCKNYSVYIVSNSARKHIKHYMDMFGIDINWFKEVISNQFLPDDPTKKPYYEYIIKKEGIKPENLYVFGDSPVSDLEPAIEINANGYFVNDSHKLDEIVSKALNENK
ncbi:MAG: HAD family hydrolase [Clostridia bacterium]|nr:HAD family hydrolase [Clostridia bacterium]